MNNFRQYISVFILYSLFLIPLHASDIVCVGEATQVVNGHDTLFIFKQEIALRSTRGEVNWFTADGQLIATNTEELYPDEGGYYTDKDGEISSPVYVFLYSEPKIDSLFVELLCDATLLNLKGDAKPFKYTRMDGSIGTCARACSIDYNALAWNTEEWVDSAARMDEDLHMATYMLPALYGATPIKLCYDPAIRSALGLDSACVETEILEDEVQAVNHEITHIATTRGDEKEKSNERNRPTSETLITSSEYSGPLEVAFYSNPTPAAMYYRWAIYKSAELLVTRNDQDIRYVFSEPGSYRVVCSVNNSYCTSDSTEVTVAIAESYLAVPNVFTPNGDGKNDEFRVAYRSLREFHCWVYNRWGKLVYEWTDPAKGWDGMIGGRPASEGAYFYVIRALGTDAAKNAQYTMKAVYNKKKLNADEAVIGVYQLSGDINLLRGKK